MDLFKLQATLGLDTSSYDDGLDEAEDKGKGFGSKLKGGFAAAGKAVVGTMAAIGTAATATSVAFVKGVEETAALGDEIDKASQKMGIATDTYQELAYAAELSGTDMGALKRAAKELLETGSDLPLTDALLECADAIDPVAAASEMFGERIAMELTPMLNTGADGIRGMMQEAEQYGMVMSEDAVKGSAKFNDSITKMKGTITGLKNGLLSQFLPAMTTITDGIAMVFNGDDGGIAVMEEGLDEMLDKIIEKLPKFLEMGGKIVSKLAEGLIEKLPKIVSSAISIIQTLTSQLMKCLPDVLKVAGEIFMQLLKAIPPILEELTKALPSIIDTICDFFVDNFDAIFDAAIDILMALIDAIPVIITKLVDNLPRIINTIVNTLVDGENLQKVLNGAIQLLLAIVQAIPQIVIALVQALPQIVKGFVDFFTNPDNWAALASAVFELGKGLITGIWEGFKSLLTTVEGWIDSALSGIFGDESAADFIEESKNKALQQHVNQKKLVQDYVQGKQLPTLFGMDVFTPIIENYLNVDMEIDKRQFGMTWGDSQKYNRMVNGEY